MSHPHRNRPSHIQKKGRAAGAGKPIVRLLFVTILTASMLSAQSGPTFPDVTALSLEDLMSLKVTSVSKRAQTLGAAPAAIFVITREDIRRSGARSVPEALRLAPGLEVARIDQNKWAIGSRGFNGRFANKLLVLIDGRTVYTPLFSGVYWNVQDVLLEDVDRIEVIRGPGATLWGANAVNGVINIITKEAQATQGGLLVAEAGNEERALGALRFGGQIGSKTYYRAYTKYSQNGSSTDAFGRDAFDGWDTKRAGFRMDSSLPEDSFSLQGNLYYNKYGETLTAPLLSAPYVTTFRNNGNFSGGNFLGLWTHAFSNSTTSLQAYYDKTNTSAESLLVHHQDIYDIDFQHDVRVSEGQELIWGMSYRSTQDKIDPSPAVTLDPAKRNLSLFSGFVQDQFGMFDNRLRVTLGSKFEHNGYTGLEAIPNARFQWTLRSNQSIWGAVSRAVRTPSRTERDMRLSAAVVPPSEATGGLPVLVSVHGNPEFDSEKLVAYEAGYRVQPTPTLSADVAVFYNSYKSLLSAEPETPFLETSNFPVHLVAPVVAANKMSGRTRGAEFFADWKVLPRWSVSGSYSFLDMNIRKNRDSLDQTSSDPGGASPRHQFYVRTSVDLLKNFEQDVTLRYVDRLSGLRIPSYYSLDARFGWKPIAALELSIGSRNLLNDRHLEFIPDFISTSPTEVKRSVYGTITFKF
jgi:iron complex outermembrane receptor protein